MVSPKTFAMICLTSTLLKSCGVFLIYSNLIRPVDNLNRDCTLVRRLMSLTILAFTFSGVFISPGVDGINLIAKPAIYLPSAIFWFLTATVTIVTFGRARKSARISSKPLVLITFCCESVRDHTIKLVDTSLPASTLFFIDSQLFFNSIIKITFCHCVFPKIFLYLFLELLFSFLALIFIWR